MNFKIQRGEDWLVEYHILKLCKKILITNIGYFNLQKEAIGIANCINSTIFIDFIIWKIFQTYMEPLEKKKIHKICIMYTWVFFFIFFRTPHLRILGSSFTFSPSSCKCCCCCCCLPCNHCSNWTWFVKEILAFGTRLRSTHCKEFNYLKLSRPAYFIRTTQLLS